MPKSRIDSSGSDQAGVEKPGVEQPDVVEPAEPADDAQPTDGTDAPAATDLPDGAGSHDGDGEQRDGEQGDSDRAADKDVTPLDGADFLAANRVNREKYRAEAERKAEKAERKAAKGRGSDDSDRTPRKLGDPTPGARSGRFRVRGSRAWFVTVAALVTLVIALAASTAVFAVAWQRADDRSGAGVSADAQGVMDTARRYAATLTTYDSADYGDLDRRIRGISTPAFADTYIKASQDGRRGNAEAKGVSTAKADDAGLVSFDGDKAVVLVALDQTVKVPQVAKEMPDGVPYQSRVKLTLVQRDGRWLIDDFDAV